MMRSFTRSETSSGRSSGFACVATIACIWCACLGGVGCGGSTGLSPVTYPLTARGGDNAPLDVNGWIVTVDEARVGFGPLYLCASISASADLCETAVAEFAAVATVDAARADIQQLGSVTGFNGLVHSALYDFAFSWPDERGPHPLVAAPEGHSAILRVTARKSGRTLRVGVALDVAPQQPRAHAVEARLDPPPKVSPLGLEITFPAAAWWTGVDFDALALSAADDVDLTAPADANGQDPPASADARSALLSGITSSHRPLFKFTAP